MGIGTIEDQIDVQDKKEENTWILVQLRVELTNKTKEKGEGRPSTIVLFPYVGGMTFGGLASGGSIRNSHCGGGSRARSNRRSCLLIGITRSLVLIRWSGKK